MKGTFNLTDGEKVACMISLGYPDNTGYEMVHVLAYLFLIEMLKTSVTRVMKKHHDEHYFRLRQG